MYLVTRATTLQYMFPDKRVFIVWTVVICFYFYFKVQMFCYKTKNSSLNLKKTKLIVVV